MSTVRRAFRRFRANFEASVPTSVLAEKSIRYAYELASSKFHLRAVDGVGRGVRTLGAPRILNHGSLSIGHHTILRSVTVPVELTTAVGALLHIGDDCFLNYGVSIGCTREIRIGHRCQFGPYVMVVDSQFHDVYDRSATPESEPVHIDDDVWVGAKASVMPGVTIGRGAVIGANAVVTRNVDPFTVVAGVPARVVRTIDPTKFKHSSE